MLLGGLLDFFLGSTFPFVVLASVGKTSNPRPFQPNRPRPSTPRLAKHYPGALWFSSRRDPDPSLRCIRRLLT